MPVPTVYTLTRTSPASSTVPSGHPVTFTVGIAAGLVSPVTITPASDGTGIFSPTSVVVSNTALSVTFTYVPNATGTHNISTTNSSTLTDPAAIALTVAVIPTSSADKQLTINWATVSNAVGYDIYLNGEYLNGVSGLSYTYTLDSWHGPNLTFAINAYSIAGGRKTVLKTGRVSFTLVPDSIRRTATMV
jgi:hypothetical protein